MILHANYFGAAFWNIIGAVVVLAGILFSTSGVRLQRPKIGAFQGKYLSFSCLEGLLEVDGAWLIWGSGRWSLQHFDSVSFCCEAMGSWAKGQRKITESCGTKQCETTHEKWVATGQQAKHSGLLGHQKWSWIWPGCRCAVIKKVFGKPFMTPSWQFLRSPMRKRQYLSSTKCSLEDLASRVLLEVVVLLLTWYYSYIKPHGKILLVLLNICMSYVFLYSHFDWSYEPVLSWYITNTHTNYTELGSVVDISMVNGVYKRTSRTGGIAFLRMRRCHLSSQWGDEIGDEMICGRLAS